MLGLCSLAFDYAAIRLAVEDSRKSVRAYLGAFRLVWRARFRTVGLYIVLWLVVLLFLGAYIGVAQLVPQTSLVLVFLLFLVRQVTVLAKVWCRLLFYSAQCALYRDLRPSLVPVEPVPGPEPEPETAALLGPELEPLTEPVPPGEPEQIPAEAPPARPAGCELFFNPAVGHESILLFPRIPVLHPRKGIGPPAGPANPMQGIQCQRRMS
jgi:hypothetical protein